MENPISITRLKSPTQGTRRSPNDFENLHRKVVSRAALVLPSAKNVNVSYLNSFETLQLLVTILTLSPYLWSGK